MPIDPAAAWDFDPEEVPTVQQLVQELSEQQQAAAGGAPDAPSSKVSSSYTSSSLSVEVPFVWAATDKPVQVRADTTAHCYVALCCLQPPSAGGEGWKGTALEAHVKYFADAFLGPLTASSRAALNERAKQAAADQRGLRDVSW